MKPPKDTAETPDEQIENFVNPIVKIITFGVQKSHVTVDDTVIEKIKQALDKVGLTVEVTEKDVAEAVLSVVHEIADMTETKTDDRIINFAQAVYEFVGGKGGGFHALIEVIKTRIAARRAARLEAKGKE